MDIVEDEGCVIDVEQGKLDFLVSLPHELSLSILRCLDYESVLTCRSVSHQWCALASDNLLWRELFLRRHPKWRIVTDDDHDGTEGQRQSLDSPATRTKLRLAGKLTRRLTDMMMDFALGRAMPAPLAAAATAGTTNLHGQASSTSWDRAEDDHVMSDPIPLNNDSIIARRGLSRSTSLSTPTRQSTVLPPHSPWPGTPTKSSLTSGILPAAEQDSSLMLDWPQLFRDRYVLDVRWERGLCKQTTLKGHQDSVYCVQFDDHKIISGSRDKTIKIWDPRTGRCVKSIEGHHGSVLCLQYDDKILVTGSSDTTIIVWDLVGGEFGRNKWQVKHTLIGHSMGVLDVAFDDNFIVSSSKDTTIRVWNKQNGDFVRLLSGHRGPVNAIQLLDGRIWSASGDSSVKLWSAATGECLRVFTGHERGLACIAISASGRLFVTGSNDRMIKLWSTETGECLRTFAGHTDLVRSLALDEEQGKIASASYDYTVRVWDLETGGELLKFSGAHSSLVFDVALSVSKLISHDHTIVVNDFGDGLDVSRFY